MGNLCSCASDNFTGDGHAIAAARPAAVAPDAAETAEQRRQKLQAAVDARTGSNKPVGRLARQLEQQRRLSTAATLNLVSADNVRQRQVDEQTALLRQR